MGRAGAHLESQKNEKGEGWYAVWNDACGKKRRKLRLNKALADEYSYVQARKIQNGEVGVETLNKITVKDFGKIYMEEYAKKNKESWITDEHNMKSVERIIGNRMLNQVNSAIVNYYKEERRREVLGPTVNRGLALIRKMYNFAKEYTSKDGDKYLLKTYENPVNENVSFYDEVVCDRWLSHEEIETLDALVSGEAREEVGLALSSGMRDGEIGSLRWRDLDFANGTIWAYKTKSGKPRPIPMLLKARQILENKANRSKDGQSAEKIFMEDHQAAITNAIEKAGFNKGLDRKLPDDKRKMVTFHTLRHTFASHYMHNGGNIYTLSKILGHHSVTTTEKIYAHHSPEHSMNEMKRIGMDSIWTVRERSEIEGRNIDAVKSEAAMA